MQHIIFLGLMVGYVYICCTCAVDQYRFNQNMKMGLKFAVKWPSSYKLKQLRCFHSQSWRFCASYGHSSVHRLCCYKLVWDILGASPTNQISGSAMGVGPSPIAVSWQFAACWNWRPHQNCPALLMLASELQPLFGPFNDDWVPLKHQAMTESRPRSSMA